MLQKIRQSKVYVYGLIIVILILAAGQFVLAGSFQPGSQEDPLVTQSYVEQRNEQLKYYFEQKEQETKSLIDQNRARIDALEQRINTQPQGGGTTGELRVVNLTAGQILTGFAGTEIILRGGKATAVQSELGGLSDVTGARDIRQGEVIPDNHLLLVPRSDGRGLKAVNDCILMVRGQYSIQ
ncbi:MAG: hypothetical protein HPY66_1985 [Firmicutes bacterium]|nr:hypothetical protein [Bacillota bacterium]MDI6705243.1 hypothetical protein [Bacillota bacterium]